MVVNGMYHGADAIAGDAPPMRRFHDTMLAALQRALGAAEVAAG